MENTEDIKTIEEKAPKKSDYLRKELEAFAYGKKPLEEWDDEEKTAFQKWCARFNNLWTTISGLADEKASVEMLKDEGPLGKYYKGIRDALIHSGVDFNNLDKICARKEEFYRMMIRGAQKLLDDKELYSEFINNSVEFYIVILPAILDLIDNGYTEAELIK